MFTRAYNKTKLLKSEVVKISICRRHKCYTQLSDTHNLFTEQKIAFNQINILM